MRRLLIPTIAAVAALAATSIAGGELVEKGNLRLSFNGQIAPQKLPRRTSAPVTVEVRSAIHTANGAKPPPLRRISIAFNRYGRVSTVGLPTCSAEALEGMTSKGALENCRTALVGHGRFRAYVNFPGTEAVAVVGQALAFNGTFHNQPAVLLHIYNAHPVRVTFVVPFVIRHLRHGTFGTAFNARIPKIAANTGYVTNLSLTFERRYRYRGRRRSFISARCAVPPGIPGATFTLARGSFVFDNGQRLSTGLTRNCWVR